MNEEGVFIKWTENPLGAKITLNDVAKKRMRASIIEEGISTNIDYTLDYCIRALQDVLYF